MKSHRARDVYSCPIPPLRAIHGAPLWWLHPFAGSQVAYVQQEPVNATEACSSAIDAMASILMWQCSEVPILRAHIWGSHQRGDSTS